MSGQAARTRSLTCSACHRASLLPRVAMIRLLMRQWQVAQEPPEHPAQPPEDRAAPVSQPSEPQQESDPPPVLKQAFEINFSVLAEWQDGHDGAGSLVPIISSKSLPHFVQRYS